MAVVRTLESLSVGLRRIKQEITYLLPEMYTFIFCFMTITYDALWPTTEIKRLILATCFVTFSEEVEGK
jgi:hypothetical protein